MYGRRLVCRSSKLKISRWQTSRLPYTFKSMVPLSWYLALSAVLFTIGVAGVLVQRNVISIFMCIELMLNSVNLTLVAFSRFLNQSTGQLFVFIVMAVAAAEAAVGLAIIISVFRNRETLSVDEDSLLKL
jgi:NADH-quinone oxidoreductase subunit K